MATTDDKKRMLKDIDRGFDITFDPAKEAYIITHNGGHFQTVPWGDFDANLLERIRKVVYININGDMAKEIDEFNEKVEISNQKRQDDMIEQTAKDIGKPLWRHMFG